MLNSNESSCICHILTYILQHNMCRFLLRRLTRSLVAVIGIRCWNQANILPCNIYRSFHSPWFRNCTICPCCWAIRILHMGRIQRKLRLQHRSLHHIRYRFRLGQRPNSFQEVRRKCVLRSNRNLLHSICTPFYSLLLPHLAIHHTHRGIPSQHSGDHQRFQRKLLPRLHILKCINYKFHRVQHQCSFLAIQRRCNPQSSSILIHSICRP